MKRIVLSATLFLAVVAVVMAAVVAPHAGAQDKKLKGNKMLRTLTKASALTRWQPIYGHHGASGNGLDYGDETSEYSTYDGITLTHHWRTYNAATDVYTPQTTVYSTTTRGECPEQEQAVTWTIDSTTNNTRSKAGASFPGRFEVPGMVGAPADKLSMLAYLPSATIVECLPPFSPGTESNYYVAVPQLTPEVVRDGFDHNVPLMIRTSEVSPGNFVTETVPGTHTAKFTPAVGTTPAKFILIEAGVTREYEVTFPQFEGPLPWMANEEGWIAVDLRQPAPTTAASASGSPAAAAAFPPFVFTQAILKLRENYGWWLKIGPPCAMSPCPPRPKTFKPTPFIPNYLLSLDPWLPEFAPNRQRFSASVRMPAAALPGTTMPTLRKRFFDRLLPVR